MESVRAELVRSYIRPPPNRTACDCCYDMNCGRSSSSRSDCKPSGQKSFFRKGSEVKSTSSSSSQFRHPGSYHNNSTGSSSMSSSSRSSGSMGRMRDDPPPPYSDRRSSAAPSFLSASAFKLTSRDRDRNSSSDHSSHTQSPSSSMRRKQ